MQIDLPNEFKIFIPVDMHKMWILCPPYFKKRIVGVKNLCESQKGIVMLCNYIIKDKMFPSKLLHHIVIV